MISNTLSCSRQQILSHPLTLPLPETGRKGCAIWKVLREGGVIGKKNEKMDDRWLDEVGRVTGDFGFIGGSRVQLHDATLALWLSVVQA